MAIPTFRICLGAMLLLVVTTGCDVESNLTMVEPSVELVESRTGVTGEEGALRELTRAVALALADRGLRMRLRHDLWASRHTPEHKLEFTSYIHGENGGILLAKMGKATGLSREDLLAMVAAVRPLELYMPGSEHREAWSGGEDVWVASLIEDDDVPVAFDITGSPVMLRADAFPAVPTLSMVPVETDFSKPLPPGFTNRNDDGGRSIGTYEPCADCIGTADHVTYGGRHGVVMTYLELYDLREAFLKGNPEIEVHVMGATYSGGSAKVLGCAGDAQEAPYDFDMNSGTWSNSEGVTLLSSADYDNFVATGSPEQLQLFVWEDDWKRCEIVADIDFPQDLAEAAGVTGAAYGFLAATEGCGDICDFVGGAALLYGMYLIAESLSGNDDYIGGLTSVMLDGKNAVLVSGGANGYMDLEYRPLSPTSSDGGGGGGCVDGVCPTSVR